MAGTNSFPEIATARLALIPIDPTTARAIIAGDLSGVHPAEGWPHADTIDGLNLAVRRGHPAGWMIVLDGRVIGDCGILGSPDSQGRIEIGYGLAAPYRGRGYGSEAVAAMVTWLSGQPGVTTIRARTASDNLPSQKVLEKGGFRLIGFDDESLAVYERS